MSNPIDEDQVRELIAIRAYEMWENEGRPHGRHALHWRQAEQEILACIREASVAGSQPGSVPPRAAAISPVRAARPAASARGAAR
jgi:Protein of unknown function (DUF2934)